MAFRDPALGVVAVAYGLAGAAVMALNPPRLLHVLRGGSWHDREIADAERRADAWMVQLERDRAAAQERHVAAARDQEWPSP